MSANAEPVTDLTPDQMESAVQIVVDWAGNGPIDWDDMLFRIEGSLALNLPNQMDDPLILRIQRAARKAVKEARS